MRLGIVVVIYPMQKEMNLYNKGGMPHNIVETILEKEIKYPLIPLK